MPIYVQDIEDWAVSQQQEYHLEALLRFGERVVLKRRWQVEDHKNGLVSRCTQCSDGRDPGVQTRLANAYKQTGDSQCAGCYGTGFQNGFMEPSIVTYMLAVDSADDIQKHRSGQRVTEDPVIQLPHMPFAREGDLIVRFKSWIDAVTPDIEEFRYIVDAPQELTVRTGLEYGTNSSMLVGLTCRINRLPSEHIYYTAML